MSIHAAIDREKARKDLAKRAVAFAMKSRWRDAAALNRSILSEFPGDVEAYNRLGKALSELGSNREARAAFGAVLQRAPHNAIAKKNLARLERLADDAAPRVVRRARASGNAFIKDSGRSGVTSLIKLAPPRALLALAPGDAVALEARGGGLAAADVSGERLGEVEPRLGSRLARLIAGGNRYAATASRVGERELVIIIREAYKSAAQTGIQSFPPQLASPALGYEFVDDEAETAIAEPILVKDWSSDDTEPGDDEAFSPVIHRIVDANGDEVSDAEGLGEGY